jgi:serine/threonine-protein kinase RsbW
VTARRGVQAEFARVFPSELDQVERVFQDFREFLRAHGAAHLQFIVELVARECVNNAVLHGNKKDPAKQVTFGVSLTARHICLEIEDQGPGFPWREGQAARLPDDADDHGRGLLILDMYAERVEFNDAGNGITVWLRRTSRED